MSKCAMCGKIVEGRYVCKSCEGKVKGNLNAENNPCYQCPYRARNCHSHCKDYIGWQKNRKAVKDIIFRQSCADNDAFQAFGWKGRNR